MEKNNNRKHYDTLLDLEKKMMEGNFSINLELRNQESDIDRLREVVDELKEQDLHVSSKYRKDLGTLGTDLSVTSDKLSELNLKIDNLEVRLEALEDHKDKTDNRVWSYIDKMIIAIISGLMTLILNNLL